MAPVKRPKVGTTIHPRGRRSAPETCDSILAKALARITPAPGALDSVRPFLDALNASLERHNLLARALLGGSAAKGTFLKGDHDVDVFVRFNRRAYAHLSDTLSDLLEPTLPDGAERLHGSRDYFQLRHGGLLFEIVPVLAVRDAARALNVMDVSPLHVRYVVERVRKEPHLVDEIRLAKQFCKAAGVYGAESYLNGFSGHVIDLLVLRYGSFLRLLAAASRWPERIVLDPERHHAKPEFALDPAKRLGPMILVDPLQPARNAAAALSFDRYRQFTEAAKRFLAGPTLAAFTLAPLTPQWIKKECLALVMRGASEDEAVRDETAGVASRSDSAVTRAPALDAMQTFLLESRPLDGKTDVVATKLLKAHEHLVTHLRLLGFTVLAERFAYDKRYASGTGRGLHAIVLKRGTLSSTSEREGPPLSAKKDATRFRESHPRAQVRNGRLYARVKRPFRIARHALLSLIADVFVMERVAQIRLLR